MQHVTGCLPESNVVMATVEREFGAIKTGLTGQTWPACPAACPNAWLNNIPFILLFIFRIKFKWCCYNSYVRRRVCRKLEPMCGAPLPTIIIVIIIYIYIYIYSKILDDLYLEFTNLMKSLVVIVWLKCPKLSPYNRTCPRLTECHREYFISWRPAR